MSSQRTPLEEGIAASDSQFHIKHLTGETEQSSFINQGIYYSFGYDFTWINAKQYERTDKKNKYMKKHFFLLSTESGNINMAHSDGFYNN